MKSFFQGGDGTYHGFHSVTPATLPPGYGVTEVIKKRGRILLGNGEENIGSMMIDPGTDLESAEFLHQVD